MLCFVCCSVSRPACRSAACKMMTWSEHRVVQLQLCAIEYTLVTYWHSLFYIQHIYTQVWATLIVYTKVRATFIFLTLISRFHTEIYSTPHDGIDRVGLPLVTYLFQFFYRNGSDVDFAQQHTIQHKNDCLNGRLELSNSQQKYLLVVHFPYFACLYCSMFLYLRFCLASIGSCKHTRL